MKESKQIKQTLSNSTNIDELKKALETLRKQEDASNCLAEVMGCFERVEDMRGEIEHFLYDIKVKGALDVLMDNFSTYSNNQKDVVLKALWNGVLDASSYVDVILEYAVFTGDYMLSLEAWTVIENLEGPFENIDETMSLLDCYIYEHPNSENLVLVEQIRAFLTNA